MKSTQHTPGPWIVRKHDDLETCEIHDSFGAFASCEAKNAQLIANAPDLLSALEECITEEGATCFLRRKSNPEYMDRRLNYISEIARSAIAKATESPSVSSVVNHLKS